MNELEQLLQQKVGLSPDQSQAVIQLVASHLQSKIPESLQGAVLPLLGLEPGADGGHC